MTIRTLPNSSTLALVLFATPSMLCAQMADPPQTPVTPEIPMPPGAPNPSSPPDEVPAQPAVPDLPQEYNRTMASTPSESAAYPPCSVTLQDQCTNTKPEADVKAVRPAKITKHRRHHKR
jgi:hypothetical protein